MKHPDIIQVENANQGNGRLIRISKLDTNIWEEDSPFCKLLQKIQLWHEELPSPLQLTELDIYIHRESNTVAAAFMLHFAYHSTVCDLTRVSLPGFDFPLASSFHHAPPAFRRHCQEKCRYHADAVSKLVERALALGGRALDDTFCIGSIFEATKIQAVHTATSTQTGDVERWEAGQHIASNLKAIATSPIFANGRVTNYVGSIVD
jgi:hypothetical protein